MELVEDLGSVVDNLAADSQRLLVSSWHRRREIRLRRGELSPDGYYRDCLDYDALGTVLLEPFAVGATSVEISGFDYRSDKPMTEVVDVPPAVVLLFEGVFLLPPEVRDRWDLALYVHVPEAVTLARVIRRDVALAAGGLAA